MKPMQDAFISMGLVRGGKAKARPAAGAQTWQEALNLIPRAGGAAGAAEAAEGDKGAAKKKVRPSSASIYQIEIDEAQRQVRIILSKVRPS